MSPPLIRSDSISTVSLLCRTIPEALAFYVGQLGFSVKCDEVINGQRLVLVSASNLVSFAPEAHLRFREAVTERDKLLIGGEGGQGGSGPFLTIETDDFDRVLERLETFGAPTVGGLRTNEDEGYRAVTLVDPMGNLVILCDKPTKKVGRVFVKDVGF